MLRNAGKLAKDRLPVIATAFTNNGNCNATSVGGIQNIDFYWKDDRPLDCWNAARNFAPLQARYARPGLSVGLYSSLSLSQNLIRRRSGSMCMAV
jgi:hypothetical protein